MAGTSAGEQPRGGAGASDGGVAGPGGDQLTDQSCQGFGEGDGGGAEHDRHTGAVVADLADGEAGDGGGALRVQEQQQARDAVGQGQGGVVQEPSRVVPAFLRVVRAVRAFPPGLVEGQAAGVPAGNSPADEVAGFPGVGEPGLAHPAVQVVLGEGSKGEPSVLLQVKDGDGRQYVAAGVGGLLQ